MPKHKMSLWEVEQFLNQTEDVARSISDAWELDPVVDRDEEGNPLSTTHTLPFDPEVLKNTIMLRGGRLGVPYNNIATYYTMCMWWWKQHKPTFQKWWEVEEKWYEPLWDRDGRRRTHEDTADTGTLDTSTSDTEVMDDDTSYQKSGTSKEIMDDDTTGSVTTSGSSNTTNEVSAFDSSTYQPHDTSSTTTSSSESSTGTDDRTTTTTWSESGTGTDDRTTTKNGTIDTDTSSDKDFDHYSHEYGNWGISMFSAKLYSEQYERRYKYNPYTLMSDIFLKEMTDCVWM